MGSQWQLNQRAAFVLLKSPDGIVASNNGSDFLSEDSQSSGRLFARIGEDYVLQLFRSDGRFTGISGYLFGKISSEWNELAQMTLKLENGLNCVQQ